TGNISQQCSRIPVVTNASSSTFRNYAAFVLNKSMTNANFTSEARILVLNYLNVTASNVSVNGTPGSSFLIQAGSACSYLPPVQTIELPWPLNFDVQNLSVVDVNLPEPNASCCALGSCNSCIGPGREPLILVHGHSFSEHSSTLESLDSFGEFQNALMLNGYLDSGAITPSTIASDVPSGLWGVMPSAVSVRASYYYFYPVDLGAYSLVSQKQEGIENYAIRLKHAIDVVRQRTNATKVDIVAHSMGGLVVREYLVLFGQDNVDDVVLIGTPNRGIVGRTQSICAIAGGSKECKDLASGSLFLQNLNSPLNIPLKVHLTTIRGEGCDVSGEPGDGLVQASSVPLDYATNYVVNGTCTDALKSSLHSDLLDPSMHPEVLELVLKSLD
ncbi:MAG: alpha/beta fold hydrolase, partial [Candidatus Woesearchaeota archaeon]